MTEFSIFPTIYELVLALLTIAGNNIAGIPVKILPDC
jgi:hypothetical protein